MPATFKPIVNLTRGTVVCERALVADRPLRRMRGLLGRHSLPAGEGVLLQPAPSIHTAFMRFPIDVVFLDRHLRVVKLVENLRPWRTASARRARSTLELTAGEVAARGVQCGDRFVVVMAPDELHIGVAAPAPSTAQGCAPSDVGTVPATPAGAASIGAEPTRVLLVGSDRRFRSAAATLLTRRGLAVTLAGRVDNVAEVARRARADVVVIDAASSLTAAAHETVEIQSLDPAVGVVLVGEAREAALPAMPVLAKWGAFDRLYDAIEDARPDGSRRRARD
jgi:uncharacterized membrane protein (UPF0127 family)/CheY-like chemotaxis protein